MIGNVTAFKNSTNPLEPDLRVIEELRGLLEKAESGQLRGIVFTYAEINNVRGYGWSGTEGNTGVLACGLMSLQFEFARQLVEE